MWGKNFELVYLFIILLYFGFNLFFFSTRVLFTPPWFHLYRSLDTYLDPSYQVNDEVLTVGEKKRNETRLPPTDHTLRCTQRTVNRRLTQGSSRLPTSYHSKGHPTGTRPTQRVTLNVERGSVGSGRGPRSLTEEEVENLDSDRSRGTTIVGDIWRDKEGLEDITRELFELYKLTSYSRQKKTLGLPTYIYFDKWVSFFPLTFRYWITTLLWKKNSLQCFPFFNVS